MLIGIPIGLLVGYLVGKHLTGNGQRFGVAAIGYVVVLLGVRVATELAVPGWGELGSIPPGTAASLGYLLALFPGIALGKPTEKSEESASRPESTPRPGPRSPVKPVSVAPSPQESQEEKNEMPASQPVDNDFYSMVAQELAEKSIDEGMWLRARIEAEGDETKTELAYARFRVQQLTEEAEALAEARRSAEEVARKRGVPAQYLGVDGEREPASKQDCRVYCKRCGGLNRIDRFRAGPDCGHCNASLSSP